MEHVIVRLETDKEPLELLEWLETSTDGILFDRDSVAHESSFLLGAIGTNLKRMAYLPVQQPLMLESLACRPGLTEAQTSLALTRLVEYAIGECYRRDAGELYFLTRDPDTAKFAERHKFRNLADVDPKLKVYRLNLLETFGC